MRYNFVVAAGIETIKSVSLVVLTLLPFAVTNCGGSYHPTDLFVMGNSITLHGPEPSVGWTGDWGMAAPSQPQDFSHLTASALNVPLYLTNLSIERDPVDTIPVIPEMANKVGPHTAVVLEFGDNVLASGLEAFGQAYNQLAAAVSRGNSLVCVSTWWVNPSVDNVIKAACVAHHGRFAYIGDIRTNPNNPDLQSTKYSDWQVNDHPQQWGHQQISERVVAQIRGQ
jgi:hypothetical protein